MEPSNGDCPVGKDYTFTASSHASFLLTGMKEFRSHSEFCDITLCTKDKELDAHRIVLACISPYFSAMFRNEHLESTQRKILLQGIDSQALSALIDYAYSSTLKINEDNVQNLLAGASLLQITSVVDACCEFLQSNLDPENCLGIAYFAEMHSCVQLYELSWRYVLENFSEVSKTEEFLTVPDIFLKELVQSDNLNVKSEEEVLDCVLKWLDYDKAARIDSVVSVLQFVKLPLIPWETVLDRILGDPLLSALPDCQAILSIVSSARSNPDKEVPGSPGHSQYIPRKSIGQSTVLYVVGGETAAGRSNVNSIEQFSPAKNTWTELSPMGTSRRGMGVATLDGYVYAIGGSDGINALRLVEKYDPGTNSWTRLADLNHERSSVSAAVVDGQLYAIGGYDGITSCLSTVERYNPSDDSWSYVTSMNHLRSMTAVGVLKKRLYVIGGYDGGSDLSSCEVYDPETDTWSLIPDMHTCRCMAGVGVLDGKLYAIGGCDCSRSLNSIEVFDPEKNQWEFGAELSECRSGLGVAVVGTKLYAVGGYTGSEYLSSIECYDPKQSGWSFVAPLSCSKRRFGCCS